jgi:AraC-like DNA-binding protein
MAVTFQTKDVVGNPNGYRPSAPLDNFLRMIRLSGVIQASSHLTAPWACKLPHDPDSVLLYLVVSGNCLVYTDGQREILKLEAGDALFVPSPIPHTMGDSLATPPVTLLDMIAPFLKTADSADAYLSHFFGDSLSFGGGGQLCGIITLRMFIDKQFPNFLLNGFPALSHLPGFIAQNREFVENAVQHIAKHGQEGFVGNCVATRLAESILTLCVKSHWQQGAGRNSRSERGLVDPFIQKVMETIYENLGTDLCIAKLSASAGLSRSAFIRRFDRVVGQTPNDFVTSLRIERATEMLAKTDVPIAQIAAKVGYASEAAFSRVFHRWTGLTPGAVRRA